MGGEWPERVLSDLISVKHGWAFKGSFFDEAAEKGPIVVAIGNFNYSGGFRFGSTKIKRYTSDYPADYELIPGEILLAMTCQTAGGEILGIPGKVPDDGNTYLHNQRLGKVIVESESVDDGYLYWLFLSRGFNHHLYCTATGTKILHTAPERILSYRFFLPPLSEQKAIAHILGSLDDKIQLNRQMNATLEAMAQALFKSWFVDFDPVIDKALAAGNPIPESFHKRAEARKALGKRRKPLPADIAQHFPDRFVFNEEMGWVPERWKESTVGTEFNITMGQSPPGSTYNEHGEGIPFFQGRTDFEFRYPTNRIYCTAPKRFAAKGDSLVSVRAPVGDVNMAALDCCIGRGVSALRHKSGSQSFTYYSMLQLREYFNVYEGEGTVFGSINQKDFKSLPQMGVFFDLVSKFDTYVGKIDEKIELNTKNICSLTSLRDTLLPKLLSGQLRIPNAENFFKDADKALQFEEAAQVDEEWLDAPLSDDEVCNS